MLTLVNRAEEPYRVEEIISPLADRLWMVAEDSRQAVLQLMNFAAGELGHPLSIRDLSKADNRMHWNGWEQQFKGRPGFIFGEYEHQPLMVHRDLSLRPKRYNRKGGASNYPTPHVRRYASQGTFDGFPDEAWRLDVCYKYSVLLDKLTALDVVMWADLPSKGIKLYELRIRDGKVQSTVVHKPQLLVSSL